MFALTCPHCKHEIQTKFARPGATVKCVKCQKTFLLDARNTREIFTPTKVGLIGPDGGTEPLVSPVAGEGVGPGASGSHQSASKVAMAAMREMTEQMDDLAPEVDIYAAAPTLTKADDNSRAIKLILAIAVLVIVLVGALWFIATTPAIRELFGSKPVARQPALKPPVHPEQPKPPERKPDGTAPAQDF